MAATDAVDVIVVGGGTAGCVVAARLVLDFNLNVTLIERGDSTFRQHPFDLFESMARPGVIQFTTVDVAGSNREYVTASTLGGGSAVNGLVVMTGDADDYDAWESEFGATGWSWEKVSQAFAGLRIVPENTNRSYFGPVGRALLGAGINAQPVTLAAHGDQRVSSDSAYVGDALATGRLLIRGGTSVRRVIIENKAVRGVECADGTIVRSSSVVMSAGALVTPRLLSASGIVHDNLGQGLQDHPSVMFPIAVKSETMARSAATAIARISSGVPGSRENDGQVIAYEYIDPTRQWAGVSVILIDVYSRGQIDVSDPKSVPDIGSLQDVRDITAMRSLVRKTVTMLSTGEFGEVFCDADGTDATHLLTLDDKSLDAWVRKHCVPLSHVSGTCAMGDNNPVDECGRVRGVSGLWVADSSVMPRIVRGNTNLPTTMIASRISEFLGEQLQPNQP